MSHAWVMRLQHLEECKEPVIISHNDFNNSMDMDSMSQKLMKNQLHEGQTKKVITLLDNQDECTRGTYEILYRWLLRLGNSMDMDLTSRKLMKSRLYEGQPSRNVKHLNYGGICTRSMFEISYCWEVRLKNSISTL